MSKTKLNILALFVISLIFATESYAASKKSHKKSYASHYNYRPKAANTKQDSLLNVPREKPLITYHEKDIPLDYIIKLDSTLNDYQTKYFIHTSPCEYDTLVTELLDDSIYIKRLQSIPTVIELTFNSVVRDYISLYTIRRNKLTAAVLGQRDYYFPIFEDALDAEGIPFELKYLPIIESALNPRAYSPAGASGLWQFISSTGRTYGLKVNSLIDERRDPIKSSKAAAQYLKHLYSIYQDWTLVIAAYNCGPGNVNKAIRRANGETDYWAIYPYLPRETRGYVPAFIAATYAMNYYQEHNICPLIIERCEITDTVHVSDKIHLAQIADVLDIDIEELRFLNPQFKTDIIPGHASVCNLILPTEKVSQFEMLKNTIMAYNVPGYVQHRVQVEPSKYVAISKGNAHYQSKKQPQKQVTNVRETEVRESSDALTNKTMISNVAANKTASGTADAQSDLRYKVKPGDTLYGIALRNKVSVVNLKKWNSLSSDNLKIGQVIVVKTK